MAQEVIYPPHPVLTGFAVVKVVMGQFLYNLSTSVSSFFPSFFLPSFLSFFLSLTSSTYALKLLNLITFGSTSLVKGSARCKYLYFTTHNIHIHAPSGIRTRNPNKRVAADLRLRPSGQGDLPLLFAPVSIIPPTHVFIKRSLKRFNY